MTEWAVLAMLLGLVGMVLRGQEDALPDGDTAPAATATQEPPTPPHVAQLEIEEPDTGTASTLTTTATDAHARGREGEGQADADTPSGLNAELSTKARGLGMTDEEILACGTDANLQRVVAALQGTNDLHARLSQQVQPQGQPEGQPQGATQEKPAEGKPTEAAAGTAEAEFPAFKLELDEAVYDSDLVKTLRAMNEHYAKQVQALAGQYGRLREAEWQRKAEDFTDGFDALVAEQGEALEPVLGKGSGREMEEESLFLKNRRLVIRHMDAIELARSQSGLPELSTEDLFGAALSAAFSKEMAGVERRKISQTLTKRARHYTARPTHRTGRPTGTPEQRAQAAVEEKLRDFGQGAPPEAVEGLPS